METKDRKPVGGVTGAGCDWLLPSRAFVMQFCLLDFQWILHRFHATAFWLIEIVVMTFEAFTAKTMHKRKGVVYFAANGHLFGQLAEGKAWKNFQFSWGEYSKIFQPSIIRHLESSLIQLWSQSRWKIWSNSFHFNSEIYFRQATLSSPLFEQTNH